MRTPDFHFLRYIGEYRLPFPAAVYGRMHFTAQSATDEVGALVAATEWIVTSMNGLVSAVLASYDRDDVQATTLPNTSAKLTLGQAVDRLDRLLQAQQKWSAQGVRTTLGDNVPTWVLRIQDAVAPLKVIVENRNELVHGGPLIESRAAEFAAAMRVAFVELLDVCAFLTAFECIVVVEARRVARSTSSDLDVRLVTGSNPIFETRRLRVDDSLEPETVYLVDRAAAVAYPLFPDVTVVADAQRTTLSLSFGMLESASRQKATWIPLDLHAGLALFAEPGAEHTGRRIAGDLASEALAPVHVPAALEQLTSDAGSTRAGAIDETVLPEGYELVGLLRRNSGSFVALATYVADGTLCVVKSVVAAALSDVPTLARVEREAEMLKRLKDSPYVARLIDHGRSTTGAPYVATEYLELGTLEEWVEQHGALGWAEMVDCLEDMVRGLVDIHGRGLLHRDISMSNLMVTGFDPMHLVYVDLGASVGALDPRVTALAAQVGTPDFMAPELLDGRGEATVASDLYAVGAVAVALLTGRPATRPSSADLDELDLPETMVELLESLLSRVPENRPPTASALLSRVLRFRDGTHPVVLRPVAAAQRHELGWWTSGPGDYFRRLPAGRYLMGGTIFPNETPVHEVVVPEPLLVATTPITNALFGQFMKATRYRSASKGFLAHLSTGSGTRGLPESWRHPEAPVVFVSWRDANEYCLWRSEREGVDYRLLSEAEWEYACRAGTRTRYYWGNTFDADRANSGQRRDGPTPVGSYPPNPWGLYDMLGNVWEWTRDRLDVVTKERSLFYSAPPTKGREAPVNDGASVITSQRVQDDFRVGRGGSWFSNDRNMRPANRRGEYEGSALRAFGFRVCVRGVPDSAIEFDERWE